METWKDCIGYEKYYQVSDLGNIRSLPRPVKTKLGVAIRGGVNIKKITAQTGYSIVNFTTGPGKRKQEFVHRLVLNAFKGNPRQGMEACHNNGVRTDNALSNLRWDTRKANHQDKKLHGTYQEGPRANNIKLTQEQVIAIYLSPYSNKMTSQKFKTPLSTVKKIKSQATWSCVTNGLKNKI